MFYPQSWFGSTSKREVRSLQSQPDETPDVDIGRIRAHMQRTGIAFAQGG